MTQSTATLLPRARGLGCTRCECSDGEKIVSFGVWVMCDGTAFGHGIFTVSSMGRS